MAIEVTNSIANQHTHWLAAGTCGCACTGRVGSAFGYIENVGIVAVDVILLLLDLSNHPCHLARRRLKPTFIRNLPMQEKIKESGCKSTLKIYRLDRSSTYI